jgi:hypothetical protein
VKRSCRYDVETRADSFHCGYSPRRRLDSSYALQRKRPWTGASAGDADSSKRREQTHRATAAEDRFRTAYTASFSPTELRDPRREVFPWSLSIAILLADSDNHAPDRRIYPRTLRRRSHSRARAATRYPHAKDGFALRCATSRNLTSSSYLTTSRLLLADQPWYCPDGQSPAAEPVETSARAADPHRWAFHPFS